MSLQSPLLDRLNVDPTNGSPAPSAPSVRPVAIVGSATPYIPPTVRPLSSKPILVKSGGDVDRATPPRRSVSGSWAIATPPPTHTNNKSPVIVAKSVHASTSMNGVLNTSYSYAAPGGIYLASSPPPSTFDELRQSQRTVASPSRVAPTPIVVTPYHNEASPVHVNRLLITPTSGSPPPPTPRTPQPPQPESVALSTISSTAIPSEGDELRLIWGIAYPVALAILFRVSMSVADVSILGHKDSDYLASAASALIWMNITSAFLYRGFGSALNTLCSQAYGAGNFKLVGYWLQQALLFSSIACLFVALSWWWTTDVLRGLGIDHDIAILSGTFARWSIIWLWPTIAMEMLQRYFQAQEIIFPALVINAVFVVVNVLLNILLVFGIPSGWWPAAIGSSLHEHGWSGLGFIGSPIATAICRWSMFLIYWSYTCLYRRYHVKTFEGWSLNRSETLHPRRIHQYLVKQCLPTSLSCSLEEWQLEIIAIFATRLGSNEIATHNATLEIFFLLTSFMFGLVTAVQVRIGSYLGSSQPEAAKQVGKLGLKVSVVIGCIVGGCFIVCREYIGRIYSSDPEIWDMAKHISILTGACYALLAFFYTATAILNGQARPLIVAIAYLIGCWCVCIPVCYVFAFPLGEGLLGLWYGMCIGYGTVTLIVSWKAYHSDWSLYAQEARQRAEINKKKKANESKESQDERRKRRRRKKRAAAAAAAQSTTDQRTRAHSLNTESATLGPSSSTILVNPSVSSRDASDRSLSDVSSGVDSDASSSSRSLSSCGSDDSDDDDTELWNREEVEYREEQLRKQRLEFAQQNIL